MMKRIHFHSLCGILLMSAAAQNSSAFVYSDFRSVAGLNLTGSASQIENTIQLTPPVVSQKGGVWHTEKQYVAGGFQTKFSFRITHPDDYFLGTDGIAFAIQNESAEAAGTEYGLDTLPALGVSFNTFQNPGEPSDNFVGIATNAGPSGGAWVAIVDLNTTSIRLKDGNAHTAIVQYAPSKLTVILDGVVIFDRLKISLRPFMDSKGKAWAGFGARTGGGYEDQRILEWSMVSGKTRNTRPGSRALGIQVRSVTDTHLQSELSSVLNAAKTGSLFCGLWGH